MRAAVFIASPISAISFPERPELADGNWAAVQAGAKVGNDAKGAGIGRALRGDPIQRGENSAHACGTFAPGESRQAAITSSPTYL
jgi:hypothetical protein